jgi:hypothetical protein
MIIRLNINNRSPYYASILDGRIIGFNFESFAVVEIFYDSKIMFLLFYLAIPNYINVSFLSSNGVISNTT